MAVYLSWVIIVFIYFAVRYIIRFFNLHDRLIEFENYKKIWWHYNFITDTYYYVPSDENWYDKNINRAEMNAQRSNAKSLRIRSNLLDLFLDFVVFPLLSWIFVIFIIYGAIHSAIENKRMPKEVKEKVYDYQFKIKHNKLSKRQIRISSIKLISLIWMNLPKDLPWDDWDFTLDSINHIASRQHRDEQYKVKWTDVQIRVLNAWWDKNDENYNKIYFVKDWIITKDCPKDFYWSRKEGKEELKRKPLKDMLEYVYILYYDEDLSDDEFREYLSHRVNNIESCLKELRKIYIKENVWFHNYRSSRYIEYFGSKDTKTYDEQKKEEKEFYDRIDKIIEKYNCWRSELTRFLKVWKVEGTVKRQTGTNWKIEESELDKSEDVPCTEGTWDAFESYMIDYYRWLLSKDM